MYMNYGQKFGILGMPQCLLADMDEGEIIFYFIRGRPNNLLLCLGQSCLSVAVATG